MATKASKRIQQITYALVVVMFLAMLLSFEKVAEIVGDATGQASDTISSYARVVLGVAIGLFLISSGVAALAVPVVGIALIAVGVVLVAYSLWPFLKRSEGE